ncbi:UNVERIFIED_CONTAM: putative mitochondrial protein [Sesamum angustifolium]|uniref:Mitochondrial protein n=1 Tax=Sesamum angustifolium TaxID=2727405 RepID=A0AAW2NYC6_9LAMI
MRQEILALEPNNTWHLTPLPARKNSIACKWIYKTKLRADGTVERYKRRLVTKGYNKVEGVDYTDSFSPITVIMKTYMLPPESYSIETAKKQSIVSRSTTDAAYRSLAATVYELCWISCILKDFGISLAVPIPLFCDNRAALHILANPVFHECTKHTELDCHIIRDAYKDGVIDLTHVKSTAQLND